MIHKPNTDNYLRAEKIVRRLSRAGFEALLAGGSVRDLLLGRIPKDYDVATSATPTQVAELFERVLMVGRQFGVCRVQLDGGECEVATLRRESAYSDGRHPDRVEFCDARGDALRRDFTINAILWDPLDDRVLDYVGGCSDLEAGVLRTVGKPQERFCEDHLRLLRAVRFATRFGFAIHEQTCRALRNLAHLCVQVSAERLAQEMRIILTDENPAAALRLMDGLGMLAHVFPELVATHGCEQPPNYHPEGDVFVHSVLTVEKLGPHPEFELALAALLHDVGKPEAAKARASDAWFPNHDQIGGEMSRAICRRLRLSNDQTECVCWLVARHHYFMNVRRMRDSKFKKLFAHPWFDHLAQLHRADALASWGVLDSYRFVMDKRASLPAEQVQPPALISGHDLIDMGCRPGPHFRRILNGVRDAQLDGEVSTRQQALQLARELCEAAEQEVEG